MEDICTYRITVRGRIDGDDLNAGSPLPILVERIGPDATRMKVDTDQSGLIGLLRHLHTRGITLIAIATLTPPGVRWERGSRCSSGGVREG
jgi:hypothetical protein